jgi:hypothetical protein
MLAKLFFSKPRGRVFVSQCVHKAQARSFSLRNALLASAVVTTTYLVLTSSSVHASNNNDKGQTKEQLLEEVKSVFPKATRQQLEQFIDPLYAEFVKKYPKGMDFKAFMYESDITDRELGKVIFRAIEYACY